MITLNDSWTCGENHHSFRLDKFLTSLMPKISRSQIQNWIFQDCFAVNGKIVKKNHLLKTGDRIQVKELPKVDPNYLVPEDIPLEIVYEDDCLIVINKQKGLLNMTFFRRHFLIQF